MCISSRVIINVRYGVSILLRGGLGGLPPRRRLMTGPLPKDGVDFRPVPVGRQVGTKTDLNINIYLYT